MIIFNIQQKRVPVRTALLDPNNVKILCNFTICWQKEIIQIGWKLLKRKRKFFMFPLLDEFEQEITFVLNLGQQDAQRFRGSPTFSPCMFHVAT